MKKILVLSILSGLLFVSISLADSDSILEKARIEFGEQHFKKAARLYKSAIDSGAVSMNNYYNAACCMANSDDIDGAFVYLNKAIDSGYKYADWLEKDMDLWPLHQDPRWKETFARCQKLYDTYLKTINMPLYLLFRADQSDRAGVYVGDEKNEIAHRDSLRREKVTVMISKNELKVSDDYYHAALIYQHGLDSLDYKLANQLANKAVELDSTNENARWLVAASQDRYLWSIGQPQWYGMQLHKLAGKWTLEPIDTTKVTDKDRRFLCVPSLKVKRQQIKEMNTQSSSPVPLFDDDDESTPELLDDN